MARTSKKNEALVAALDIVQDAGVNAVTYDSLSQATGMTKSGLIYHFPTRHDLLVEMHRFCAQRWEAELEKLGGGRAEELTRTQRQRALVLSLSKNDPLVELLMSIHAQSHPDFQAIWKEVDDEWTPDPSRDVSDEAELQELIVAVLGMGLWVHDHVSETHLSADNRKKILEHMLQILDADA